MTTVKDVRVIILALREVRVMDASGAQALNEIIADLRRRGMTVLLKGLDANQLKLARSLGVIDALGTSRHYMTDMAAAVARSEEHTSELQSRGHLVCRLLLE